MQPRATGHRGELAGTSGPRLERTGRDDVRYLPVISTKLREADEALLEFSVHCPRRGKICLTDCMDCSHAGRLRHHGRRGPLVLECTLDRHWRGGRR